MALHQNEGEQETHGGMDHGMGMMLLGCVVPMAAIVLLPRVGVSTVVAVVIGIVGMIVIHGGIMAIQQVRIRKAGNAAGQMHAHHPH